MSPGSSTESYPAFARIGLRENPGKTSTRNVFFPQVVIITKDVKNHPLLEYSPHIDVSLTCEHDPKIPEYMSSEHAPNLIEGIPNQAPERIKMILNGPQVEIERFPISLFIYFVVTTKYKIATAAPSWLRRLPIDPELRSGTELFLEQQQQARAPVRGPCGVTHGTRAGPSTAAAAGGNPSLLDMPVAPMWSTVAATIPNPAANNVALVKGLTTRARLTTLDDLPSDHLPVIMEIMHPVELSPTAEKFNYKAADWVFFQDQVAATLPSLPPEVTPAGIDRNEQFGFHPGRSTTLQALRMTEDITWGMSTKRVVAAVYLDIERAFDKVWHEELLVKLLGMGVPDGMVRLISDYLRGRTFKTRVGTSFSTLVKFTQESRRIDYRSHTFLIYSLMTSVSHISTAEVAICISMQMTLPSWRWAKPTGIIMDSHLTFRDHIHSLLRKANGLIVRHYPILAAFTPDNLGVGLTMYKALIRSVITYAAPAWGFAAVTHLRKLQVIQNQVIRIITHLRESLREKFHDELNLPTVDEFIARLARNLYEAARASPNPLISGIGRYDLGYGEDTRQEMFYLRKLWLFVFGIHNQENNTAQFYCYHEGQANRGPIEVCTFVNDYISELDSVKELHVFSDPCGGQNRNNTVLKIGTSSEVEDRETTRSVDGGVVRNGEESVAGQPPN
ncbi:hypothetical protein ANN_26184 [Periplaneta americana]|uniref:Uncharacterized protein n=1 Tax=Periplaneta americana TaxID=6978 RepID=A0ABQ8S5P0_PERAM|nr:hypothetical protein ANN_26184 [Periplaneta americana]